MLDATLIRDIRAAGIPYEPEVDRLGLRSKCAAQGSWFEPVRFP